MKTMTSVKTLSGSLAQAAGSIMAVMAIGVTLMFVAGHAQSATLHDAAHDMRHATGFPCH
ncbi:CbtB domain-containing protein [Paragemmobacter straminiformis]